MFLCDHYQDFFQKHPAKSKITASKKPVKIFEDKQAGVSVPLKCEAETQTLVEQMDTAAQTVVTGTAGLPGMSVVNMSDLHNDSGVGSVDIDQEAYDLLVGGRVDDIHVFTKSFFSHDFISIIRVLHVSVR